MIRASQIVLCASLLLVLFHLLFEITNSTYKPGTISATLCLSAAFFCSLQSNRGYRLLAWMMGCSFYTVMLVLVIDHLASALNLLPLYKSLQDLYPQAQQKIEWAHSDVKEGIVGILVTLGCAFPMVVLLRRELRAIILWDEEVKASEHREVESILAAPELKVKRSKQSEESP
ncbi:MAG: hypothetical protein R3242_03755 [Akkermansiaceae bacterium]|nr:hypothetical protein [Akkermansiaceae bacterium]